MIYATIYTVSIFHSPDCNSNVRANLKIVEIEHLQDCICQQLRLWERTKKDELCKTNAAVSEKGVLDGANVTKDFFQFQMFSLWASVPPNVRDWNRISLSEIVRFRHTTKSGIAFCSASHTISQNAGLQNDEHNTNKNSLQVDCAKHSNDSAINTMDPRIQFIDQLVL